MIFRETLMKIIVLWVWITVMKIFLKWKYIYLTVTLTCQKQNEIFYFFKRKLLIFFPHWNHIKYATELQTELQEIENTHESFLISENGKNGEASWKAGFPQHTFLHIERILIVRKNHSELRNQAGRWLCPADYFAGLVWWCNLGLL